MTSRSKHLLDSNGLALCLGEVDDDNYVADRMALNEMLVTDVCAGCLQVSAAVNEMEDMERMERMERDAA